MPNMMKAAVVLDFERPLIIEKMPIPDPANNRILVRFAATGVCHSALHAAHGDWPVNQIHHSSQGHEGVGYVAKAGRSVKRLKEGDWIGVPWLHTGCGYRSHCRTGWEILCGSQQNTGYYDFAAHLQHAGHIQRAHRRSSLDA